MKSKKVLPWISCLQTVGILLVVLGHSLPIDTVSQNPAALVFIRNIAYSFHMALFFCISGFLFISSTHQKNLSYFQFLLQKSKRLLIPYFILGFIALLPHYLLNQFAEKTVSLSPQAIFLSFLFPADHPIRFYWFLAVLFSLFILTPLFQISLRSSLKICLTFCVLIAFNIFRPVGIGLFALQLTQVFALFFFLGIVYVQYKDNFQRYMHPSLTLFASVSFAISFYFFWYCHLTSIYFIQTLELILALSGVTVTLMICRKIEKLPFIVHVISQYSFLIFLLSIFPQVFFKILFQLGMLNYWLTVFAMFLSGTVFPIFIGLTLKKFQPRFHAFTMR